MALDHPVAVQEYRDGRKKLKKGADTPRDQFRKFFHAEADDDVGVVEDYTHGVPQALRLMNSAPTNDTTAVVDAADVGRRRVREDHRGPVPARAVKKTDPRRNETNDGLCRRREDATTAYADLMWVLLNSGEFVFNH